MEQMLTDEGYVAVEDGLRLYYRVVGTGSRVILMSPACWLAADLEPLAAGHTLIFYDQRNRGRSETVVDLAHIGVEYEVRDIEAMRCHFGVERLALVGCSYFGGVTALYAAEHPDRVDRLLLLCPIPPRDASYSDADTIAADARVDPTGVARLDEMRAAGMDTDDPEAFCRAYWDVWLPHGLGNPAAARYMRSNPCACPNEWGGTYVPTLQRMWQSLRGRDWRPVAATLRVPTLVVHGTDDPTPASASREWATSIPEARLLVMHGCGHMPWLEDATTFFPAARTFLDGHWPVQAHIVCGNGPG